MDLVQELCSDGVSIPKALKEGLKGSTQKAFYKAYDIGGPMLAIGLILA